MAHEAIVSAREVEAGSRKEQSGERGSMGERERDSTRIERTKGRGLSKGAHLKVGMGGSRSGSGRYGWEWTQT